MDALLAFAHHVLDAAWWYHLVDAAWWAPVLDIVWILIKIFAIVLPILGAVAYTTLWERKLIGWMHIRLGPNRVGPLGLLQPIADAVKLLLKEVIAPTQADKFLFFLAPVMVMMPALAAWAVDPVRPRLRAGRHQRRAAAT